MIPTLRSLISIPAGLFKMSLRRFLVFSTIGTLGWSAALAGGAAIALRRKFSASAFWPDVQRYQATCFGYIGELCRYLLNQPEGAAERNNSLRCMIGNGLRPSIWSEFKARFGIEQITEFYASSEGNIGFTNVFNFDNTVGFTPATYAIVRYDLDNDQAIRDKKGFLQKAKKGEPGLLISEISAKWPFDGYTDPAKSEAAILRNVFKQGDAWFNTGDLIRVMGFGHIGFLLFIIFSHTNFLLSKHSLLKHQDGIITRFHLYAVVIIKGVTSLRDAGDFAIYCSFRRINTSIIFLIKGTHHC
jgi:acyl-CoA synthetase (AMP-forming)/AMP-acid ligase II